MKIIDLHTHVLPGVDDGADCLQTALEMLKNADASHVIALAATPHCNCPNMPRSNFYGEEYMKRLGLLRREAAAAGIEAKILTGMELRAGDNLKLILEQGWVLGLNGTRYLLTEFRPDVSLAACRESLQLILEHNYIPLVAHPERYGAIWQNPAAVNEWLDMGCHVQITGGSILGKFGRDSWVAADYLIKNDLVAIAASDAHGLRYRTNNLISVYDHLSIHYSPRYAKMLLLQNPYAICQNETL